MPAPQPQPSKAEWRAQGRAVRRGLTPEQRAAAAERVVRHLLALPLVREAAIVSVYVSIQDELDTHGLILELLRQGKSVALPRIDREANTLVQHVIDRFPEAAQAGVPVPQPDETGFMRGAFGILEPDPVVFPEIANPSDLDVICVPGLVFDKARHRIGYGGGYYDRLLAEVRPGRAIGLAFQCQIIPAFEPDPWDRSVDLICTETGMH